MNDLQKLGIKIGHYTDRENLTGATVIIPDNGADIGIDVRGSDTGSLNIPAYQVKGADKLVQAVVLTGGSTAGLESAIGVMDCLDTPSVVGAVIYDRLVGNDVRPHLKDGYEMAKTASYDAMEQGNIGVGTGAGTGKWNFENRLKGGFGMSVKELGENIYVGAFVAVNAMGDVVHPVTKTFYSETGQYSRDNYFSLEFKECSENTGEERPEPERGTNTTLAVIVTNIEMEREPLTKLAELAHDGMARAIYPVHTNWDGDIAFAISPHSENRVKVDMSEFDLINCLGLAVSDVMTEAINNAVKHAESVENFPSYSEMQKK